MIKRIREGLRVHSAGITVTFDYGRDIFDELNNVIEEWMEAAQEETAAPDEGDYIRCQMGGYTYTSTSEQRQGRWYYKVRIEPSYYTFLSQEEEVTEAVRKIRRSMFFWPWTSREKKIRKIYDYLCRNVHYDKVHRKNPYYHRRSTAYGALVQGTATCQGYCTAMYRLLREEGIPCRIVTGTAGDEELHAWLIAELDGSWYLLDPTWDAGQENYRYCLRGTDDFRTGDGSGTGDPETGVPEADPSEENSRKTERSESGETGGTGLVLHVPGPVFQTEDFLRNHPMAAQGR